VRWVRPLPKAITRPASVLILVAWVAQMAVLVNRAYLQASVNLATDLGRYGSGAQWRGVYYRGEKLGFTVSQTIPTANGFELQEDGRLQMTLLGAHTVASLRTTAQVDRTFMLRSFEFSLDPGTGPIVVRGEVRSGPAGQAKPRLKLDIKTAGGTRTSELELEEPPTLALNLARRLASSGLTTGARHQWTVFDPATLRNAPVTVQIGRREIVRADGNPIPAFRVELEFAGLRTTSWVTDTGEVVREESPMGLISVRETAERATALAVPGQMRTDMLQAAAVVPVMKQRFDEPRDVRRLRMRLEGVDLSGLDLDGVGQSADGNIVEIRDAGLLMGGAADPSAPKYLSPEPLLESDAPEIRAEAEKAVDRVKGNRARAEALTRYVNGLIEKKPTVSLPSALEVLRTRIGDCNEHTALYVAMARSIGIPARIAVGLVFVHGAFYYHAWPEVYVDEGVGRGLWLPVDPTFNQFPVDTTHLRLARGGLDKQAAIMPMIGRLKMTVLDLELAPGSVPILVGPTAAADVPGPALPIPTRSSDESCDCWSEKLMPRSAR
jgi:hypothetical protein